MSKNVSAIYYQENKAHENIKFFLKKKKKKATI